MSPQEQTLYVGLPGPSGQVGASDTLPPLAYLAPGPTLPDGGLATVGLGPGELPPDAGRAMIPNSNILAGGDGPNITTGPDAGVPVPGAGGSGSPDGGDPSPTYNPNGFNFNITFDLSNPAALVKNVGTLGGGIVVASSATAGSAGTLSPWAGLFLGAVMGGNLAEMTNRLQVTWNLPPSLWGICVRMDCLYGVAMGDNGGIRAGFPQPNSAPTISPGLYSPGTLGQGGTQPGVPSNWGTPSGSGGTGSSLPSGSSIPLSGGGTWSAPSGWIGDTPGAQSSESSTNSAGCQDSPTCISQQYQGPTDPPDEGDDDDNE